MEQLILKIADDAQQGLSNPLDAFITLKRIEKTLEQCLKATQPLAIEEANRYHEKTIERAGVKIEKRRAAGRWDYSGVTQWAATKKTLETLQELSQQAFRAQAKGQAINITDEHGEIIAPASYTEGADTIALKFTAL